MISCHRKIGTGGEGNIIPLQHKRAEVLFCKPKTIWRGFHGNQRVAAIIVTEMVQLIDDVLISIAEPCGIRALFFTIFLS